MTEKRTFTAYLLWAFGIAWALQLTACWFFSQGNRTAYQMILMLSMFAPLAASFLSRANMKNVGWKPHIKKNIRYILLAWLLPAILGAIGAALYFLLFPAAFDTTFGYITAQVGEEGIAQIEAQGVTLPLYGVIVAVQALTCAPFVNMIPAMGEEAGWRGVMYPALRERFGVVEGRILGGVIWGAWHWPVMLLSGYEYGTGYWGEPITGMVMFCIFTVAAGIFLDWLYERSGCIWLPSLGHGAINAFVGIPTLFLNPDFSDRLLLGPLMIGIIGGLPLILTAVFLCVKREKHIAPVQNQIDFGSENDE